MKIFMPNHILGAVVVFESQDEIMDLMETLRTVEAQARTGKCQYPLVCHVGGHSHPEHVKQYLLGVGDAISHFASKPNPKKENVSEKPPTGGADGQATNQSSTQ